MDAVDIILSPLHVRVPVQPLRGDRNGPPRRLLLCNTRPIRLEAYLKRLLSTIVFKRLQRKAKVLLWGVATSYAYRPHISPQFLAIVTR